MTTPERSPSSGSDEPGPRHEPVLVEEVVAALVPRAGGVYVDATVGLGGHAEALLRSGAGRLIGIDRDQAAIALAAERLSAWPERVALVHADYRRVGAVVAGEGVSAVDGVLVDFGVSSLQLDDPARGFSWRAAGPLDMRMDRSSGATLAERLAAASEGELADAIWRFGEERRSRPIARAIVAARDRGELSDTMALAAVVRRVAGGRGWQRIDPATRTFQALRIWVNRELEGLEAFLDEAFALVVPGGRLAAVAFHSLEDRVVKHTLRRWQADGRGRVLTRRPARPGEAEARRNRRARSARLRVVERTA
jgi:16S rRNA (cytosine1402-N4)-methyltransferase